MSKRQKADKPKKMKGKKRDAQRSLADLPSLSANVPTLQDILAPDGFDRSRMDVFRMGRYWIRSLFITAFPRSVDVGWLAPFIQTNADIDLAVHVFPLEGRAATDALTRIIARLEAERGMSDGSIHMVQELDTAIQDAWATRDRLQKNYSRLYHVSVVANLYATSMDELDDQQTVLEGEMARSRIHMRYAESRMDDGFLAAGPLGVNLLNDTYRLMDSYAISTTFPFTHADLQHAGGYPIGINLQTGSEVFYNPADLRLENRNMVIYATSGAGKTSSVRVLIGREAVKGVLTAILDPEGEYEPLIQALGGQIVHIGSPDSILNPLEIWFQEEEDGSRSVPFDEKILDFITLLRLMMDPDQKGNLTSSDEMLAEQALRAEYAKRGITDDPESLWESERYLDEDAEKLHQARRRKPMPTLTDWYQTFCAMAKDKGVSSKIPDEFPRFLRGHSLGFFDGESTVDLQSAPIVAFDTLMLENKVARPVGIQVALNWLWQSFVLARPSVAKRVVIDEAWQFVDYGPTMDFLETMVRRVRKRNAGVTIISQDYRRFAGHPKTQAINTNCSTQLFMKMKPNELPLLQEAFDLSAGEVSYLKQADQGIGLLRIPHLSVGVQIRPAPAEKQWAFAPPTRRRTRRVPDPVEPIPEPVDEEANTTKEVLS